MPPTVRNGRASAPYVPAWFPAALSRDGRAHVRGAEPEDVLQELQLTMLERGLSRAEGVRLRWLLLDVLRRLRCHDTAPLLDVAAPEGDLERRLDFVTAARHLDATQRLALEGAAAGKPLRAVARELGVSVATAHRVIAGARARLVQAAGDVPEPPHRVPRRRGRSRPFGAGTTGNL